MNRLAFQTYGTKKLSLFQSVWDTTKNSVVGTELANTAATTPLPVGWAGANLLTGGYTHTAGNTAALLVNNLTPTAGQSYQVICTLSAGSTGSFVVNWGGMSSVAISATTTITLTPINITSKLSITPSNDFVGTVSLSIRQSSSAANQIQLPISIASGKSVWVDWGDNSYTNANNGNIVANRIHTYSTPGEYAVRILGDNFSFGFGSGNINDRLKLKSISSWGKLKIGATSFNGCSNVTMSGITDIPDLTGVTSLNSTFYDCREITTIGRINEWNTSSLIDASSLFRGCYKFNSDISNWNVSNVTGMFAMLYDARAFNQPIGNWERSTPGNVSTMNKVTSTRSMFSDAYAFNQNIGTWNVSNVLDMGYMFRRAYAFNQNLSNWNVTKVAIFENMFESATAFNNGFASGVANQLPWTINTSPTASVIMGTMFNGATSFNSNLGTGTTPWDVSKVTTFASMFQGASKFNNGDDTAPINNWSINTMSGVSMANMFYGVINGVTAFNREISKWNMSKVTSLSGMFWWSSEFNNGLNTSTNPTTGRTGINGWNINTSSPVTMDKMFSGTKDFNRPLLDWDTSTVTTMDSMFYGVTNYKFNQDISKWNVGKVTSFVDMFRNSLAFNNGSNSDTNPITGLPGINGWNINTSPTAAVSMTGMFNSASVFNRDISSWSVSKATNTSFMFFGASAFNQPLANWERSTVGNVSTIGNITNMQSMFQSATAFNQNIGNWNVTKVTNLSQMFQASGFNNNGSSTINNWAINTSANVNMASMFSQATAFNQPLNSWNVSNVIDMSSIFYQATTFNQDISSWNVGKVTTFQNMFGGATAFNNGGNSDINPITLLPGINGWNINTTATSVSMNRMFAATRDFNRNINDWNVSKVTDMNEMFNSTQAFNQPINSWNTVSVLGMVGMFELATAFNQPIDNWNMTNVTATRYMFNGATIFNQPLSNWERVGSTLASVTSMNNMFQNAVSFNRPIGNWNVSNVANFIGFMNGKTSGNFSSTNLDAIYNGWIVNGVKPNTSSPLSTNISFGTAKYTSAGTPGKNTLLASPNNWIIQDGGI